MEAKKYLGLKQVGALFDVSGATVSKWRTRYAETDHPCPEPIVWIGDTPGWDDPVEWKGWKETLPGQGSGGGPLPLTAATQELARSYEEVGKTAQGATSRMSRMALLLAAAHYGVDKDTIMGVWGRIAEEHPDMDVEQVDQRAVATIMRGRKPLELTTGED